MLNSTESAVFSTLCVLYVILKVLPPPKLWFKDVVYGHQTREGFPEVISNEF